MTLSLRSAVLAASALILLFSSACGSDDDGDEQAAAPAAAVTVAATTAPSTAGQAATQVATATATPAGPQLVTMKAGEWFFEPSTLSVRPGTVKITMTNDGPDRPHTLVIRQPNGDTELIRTERVEVGQSITVDVNATAVGTYEMLCVLPGHADRGQKGTFTVAS